ERGGVGHAGLRERVRLHLQVAPVDAVAAGEARRAGGDPVLVGPVEVREARVAEEEQRPRPEQQHREAEPGHRAGEQRVREDPEPCAALAAGPGVGVVADDHPGRERQQQVDRLDRDDQQEADRHGHRHADPDVRGDDRAAIEEAAHRAAGAAAAKAARPAYRAAAPSSSSIRSSRLYLATRSEREGAPVLSWPVPIATARSAMVVSSVSPERWLIIAPQPAPRAMSIAPIVSVSVPIWFSLISTALAARSSMPRRMNSGFVTNRSSPTSCTRSPMRPVKALQPDQSSSARPSSRDTIG